MEWYLIGFNMSSALMLLTEISSETGRESLLIGVALFFLKCGSRLGVATNFDMYIG
jgi:hypothetical protein